jgi:hypothetical protein
MTTILIAKDKILIVMNTCDYKPCSCFEQVAKDNQSQKVSCVMYNHTYSCISLVTTWIFHPLTNHRTVRLHEIWGIIFLIIKYK